MNRPAGPNRRAGPKANTRIRSIPLRRQVVLGALLAAAIFSGFAGLAGRTAKGTILAPQVICLTEWGEHPEGWYRTRPHSCDLHERGKFPVAHVNTYTARRLHWLHWGASVAVAKGKLGVSTYGLAPLKLRLAGARYQCGHTVFTRARLEVLFHFEGHSHRSKFWISLDTCLH